MLTVGVSDARRRFAQLLGRVARGEMVVITNRGRPVGMLVPPQAQKRENVKRVVEEMLRVRDEQGPTLGKRLTVRRMIEEGRRC